MVVIKEISAIELIPVTEPLETMYQGFFVKAYKRTSRKKMGFLMNCIRTVTIDQQNSKNGILTKILWLLDQKTVLVEEYNSKMTNQVDSSTMLKIKFNDLDNPKVIRGNAKIVKNKFEGKNTTISWVQDNYNSDIIITITCHNYRNLSCEINHKTRKLDIKVERTI
ncbi:MAG: hypothetical protein ACXAEU_23230 [Candidatus Hodarchaeales archaeon]|jgi:hypothetical protein